MTPKKAPYLYLFIFSFLQAFLFLNYNEVVSTKILYLFSTFFFYIVLLNLNKIIFKIFIIISFLISTFIYSTYVVYGEPDFNYVTALVYTNSSESISYIKSIPTKVYVYLSIFLLFTILILTLNQKKINKKLLIALILFLFFFPLKKLISYGYQPIYLDRYFNVLPLKRMAYFIPQYNSVQIEKQKLVTASKKKDSWLIENPNSIDIDDYFVLIVGESVRRDFLGAYGFYENNTPFISGSNRIQFNDYISNATQTVPSLLRTLCLTKGLEEYQLNNNIINLAKKVGYDTYWISNQAKLGYHDTPVSMIAEFSNHVNFIGAAGGTYSKHDTELLKPFKEVINSKSNQSKFIVLHMIGSHAYSCDRTDGKFSLDLLSKDVSCYEESIRILDSFLEELNTTLQKTNKKFKMVYFSDHGETIQENFVLSHGGLNKQQYEVPLLIWGNDIETITKNNSARQSTDLLILFNELNNIQTQNLKSDFRFLSEEDWGFDKRKIITRDNKFSYYEDLPSNSINLFIRK